MYPDSLLQWLGTVALVFGLVILLFVAAVAVDHRIHRHDDDDDGTPL